MRLPLFVALVLGTQVVCSTGGGVTTLRAQPNEPDYNQTLWLYWSQNGVDHYVQDMAPGDEVTVTLQSGVLHRLYSPATGLWSEYAERVD